MRSRSALLALILTGCYSTSEGVPTPLDRVYFPVGLAVAEDQAHLFVANSDFDLQFEEGSLLSLDLERLRGFVPRSCDTDTDCSVDQMCDSEGEAPSFVCVTPTGSGPSSPCGVLGSASDGDRVIVPGGCEALDFAEPQDGGASLLVDAVSVGAFAADVKLRYHPEGGRGRLFVPVRGEASLTYVDIDESGHFDCGQGKGSICSDRYRVGTDPDESIRDLRMPAEPFGMAITDDARAIAVTHQTSGEVSLFVQDPEHWEQGPTLSFVHPELPKGAVAIAAAPEAALTRLERAERAAWASMDVRDQSPAGFLVGYRTTARLDLLRYFSDQGSSPPRPFLELAGSVPITANALDYDTRGILYDDSERRACEASCPAQTPATLTEEGRACLLACATVAVDVFVTNRSPATLLVGATIPDTWATPNRDLPRFTEVVSLPAGPSRVYVGSIITEQGELERRVFAVCFDSRRIAIYDPKRRRIEAFVTTGRGPHAMAFDVVPPDPDTGEGGRAFGYVAHFTDSYLGVIELDRRARRTYGKIVLNVGKAAAPRASK